MTIALPSASEVAAALIAREELPPEKGDIGPEGKAGTNGESIKGERGEKGDSIKGEPGTHGKDGRSMFAGEAHPIAVLGKAGDLYLDTITGAVWRRDTEWREVGNLRGPAAKAAIDGRDGTSISAGAGQPIAPSNEGDLYLETNTGDLYRFDTGAWHVIGNLRGPKGETGATGRGGLFPRPGGGSSGSGLPSGGTVGQVVTNTAPGTGTWQDGSGLPPQWTDGGNGDVTATTDDETKTPFTIKAPVGSEAGSFSNIWQVVDENGDVLAYIDPSGDITSVGDHINPSNGGGAFIVKNHSGSTRGRLEADDGNNVATLEVGGGLFTATRDYTSGIATFAAADNAIRASVDTGSGEHRVAFFTVTPVVQQTIDAATCTPEDIANILIAYGLAVQSP